VPELPEVETIRRELAPELARRRIRAVRVHHDDLILGPASPAEFARAVRGRVIGEAARRAKVLLLPLHDPARAEAPAPSLIRVQLRMTGRFWLAASPPDPAEFRHPGIDLALDDGRTLYYDDVRRLGGFEVLRAETWAEIERDLGPEPLEAGFTGARLAGILAGRRAPIKNVLLDQRRVAGVGNIYASEALFRARIDPRRPAGSLGPTEVARLQRAIRGVLRAAIRGSGTTVSSYRAMNGRSGTFQNELRAYGREGEPCVRCRTPVERVVQAGRSTYFCPRCQPRSRSA